MEDLISRQNAIRWVKTNCNPYGKPTLDYESSIKIIDHLEKMQSEPRWIPCSERLPEEFTVVLVSDGEKIGIAYRREYLWYHEEYLGNIAAWMPLPEPYKGGDE